LSHRSCYHFTTESTFRIGSKTLEPTATRPPELSWPEAFNLLDQIRTERTTTKDSALVVNNLDSDQYQGATGKWIPLDGPFSVGVSFDYQSSWSSEKRYATLILLGNPPNPGKEWEGLKQLWLSIRPDILKLEISDGASEKVVVIMSSRIKGINRGSKFSVVFSDPQGKQFSVVDENGTKVMEIDVTKLSEQLSSGLFPEKKLRAGFILTPRSEMTISEFSLRKPSVAEIVKPADLPALKELSLASMKVGSVVELWTEEPIHEARYMESFTRMFNLGVVGGLDMNSLLPNVEGDVNIMNTEEILSQIDWSEANQIVSMLKPTGVKIRGYNVVDETPFERVPPWLAKMSTERLREFLPAYVKAVISRYPEISEWAVVLEPLWSDEKGWAGFASNSFWYSRLGKDYFKIAFKAAKEANPKIETMLVENLSYGDHTNIVLNEEFNTLYNLLTELKQSGVPIDHVGLETHLLARDFKTEADITRFKQEMIQAMQKLAGLGLKVDITELDVNLAGVPGSEAEQLAWQAKINSRYIIRLQILAAISGTGRPARLFPSLLQFAQ
jgi:GH35 family endo-1,4-beta-xylanase